MNCCLWVNSPEEMFTVLRNIDPTQNQGGTWYTCVDVLGPDGKAKRTVIWECGQGATIRLDPKGNIYLADILKPVGRSYPEFFDGKLARPKPIDEGRGAPFWNSYLFGSIIKFPPSGGAIWFSDKIKV